VSDESQPVSHLEDLLVVHALYSFWRHVVDRADLSFSECERDGHTCWSRWMLTVSLAIAFAMPKSIILRRPLTSTKFAGLRSV
jgi:hypothetical protein